MELVKAPECIRILILAYLHNDLECSLHFWFSVSMYTKYPSPFFFSLGNEAKKDTVILIERQIYDWFKNRVLEMLKPIEVNKEKALNSSIFVLL